jgi:hypothetical protein
VNDTGSNEETCHPGTNLTNRSIFHVFEISPFASVPQAARMTVLPKTKVDRYVKESLDFVHRILCR